MRWPVWQEEKVSFRHLAEHRQKTHQMDAGVGPLGLNFYLAAGGKVLQFCTQNFF